MVLTQTPRSDRMRKLKNITSNDGRLAVPGIGRRAVILLWCNFVASVRDDCIKAVKNVMEGSVFSERERWTKRLKCG